MGRALRDCLEMIGFVIVSLFFYHWTVVSNSDNLPIPIGGCGMCGVSIACLPHMGRAFRDCLGNNGVCHFVLIGLLPTTKTTFQSQSEDVGGVV